MVFDIKRSENKKVEEMYERAIKELGKFFDFNWNKHTPKVILVPDRETYNAIAGEKTKDWEEGSPFETNDTIFMFSPEKIDSETSHEYSDEMYYSLIKHELCHLFMSSVCEGDIPSWIDEGIAVYSEGDMSKYYKPEKFEHFLDFYKRDSGGYYYEMGRAVEILVNRFGKEGVLDFAKACTGVETKGEIGKIFKKFFGIDLSYEWFNKMLEETK